MEWDRWFATGRSLRVEFQPIADAMHPHDCRLVSVLDPGPIVGHGLKPITVEDVVQLPFGRLLWEQDAYRGRVRLKGREVEVYIRDQASIPIASVLHRTVQDRYESYVDYIVEESLGVAYDCQIVDDDEAVAREQYRSFIRFSSVTYSADGAAIALAPLTDDVDFVMTLLLDPSGDVLGFG